MKKVFIEYNPYTLTTHITVDGKELKANSELANRSKQGIRMQEWIEDLPDLLYKEFNDRNFCFKFHGTKPDCDDLAETLKTAVNEKKMNMPETGFLTYEPTKETADREKEIIALREELRNCVLKDYLYTNEVHNAFKQQEGKNFPVCVVATMSAGKSTLINAMIGEKLMPQKNKACTAIITRISNTSDKYRAPWKAEVRNKNGKLIRTFDDITLAEMKNLNDDKSVYTVDIDGNIPFLSCEDVSLSFIDTPGPNNPHDPNHKKTQEKYLEDNAKPMILFVLSQQFETDDNHKTLKDIAEMMKVGGKQSRDRFIFAFNQMDRRNIDDDDTAADAVRDLKRFLLENYQIEEPNIFPVSALAALNIRRVLNGECDETLIVKTKQLVETLMMEGYDFEAYSSLSRSERTKLKDKANLQVAFTSEMRARIEENAKNISENKRNDYIQNAEYIAKFGNAALIHSGVPALEMAIKQYAEKYAKTAKIKMIADVIRKHIEEEKELQTIADKLSKAKNDKSKIDRDIENAKRFINDANTAKDFENKIETAVDHLNNEMKTKANDKLKEYQWMISEAAKKVNSKYRVSEIDGLISSLNSFVNQLQAGFVDELNKMIQDSLENAVCTLKNRYENILSGLSIGSSGLGDVSFTAIDLVSASIPSTSELVKKLAYTEQEDDGNEWVENTDKKWYKPWTWFQEKGYWRTKYKDVEYIGGLELFEQYVAPINEQLYLNCESGKNHALNQAKKISPVFMREFDRLNQKVNNKLIRLEDFTSKKHKAEDKIEYLQAQNKCLEDIRKILDSILAI